MRDEDLIAVLFCFSMVVSVWFIISLLLLNAWKDEIKKALRRLKPEKHSKCKDLDEADWWKGEEEEDD